MWGILAVADVVPRVLEGVLMVMGEVFGVFVCVFSLEHLPGTLWRFRWSHLHFCCGFDDF